MIIEPGRGALRLTRKFTASPERVFKVWTEPDYVVQWFRPSEGFSHERVELDVCEGGRYRVGFRAPDGNISTVSGEFFRVDRPRKLVYSWMWEAPHEFAGVNSQVTVEFDPNGDGTVLTLTHERLAAPSMPEQHSDGWTGALCLLTQLMDRQQNQE